MSKPDWSRSPEGATHYNPLNGMWYKLANGKPHCHYYGHTWRESGVDLDHPTIVKRPAINRAAQRAKLAPAMWKAFNRLKELRAANDMLGIRQQLKVYREARDAWEAV